MKAGSVRESPAGDELPYQESGALLGGLLARPRTATPELEPATESASSRLHLVLCECENPKCRFSSWVDESGNVVGPGGAE